MFADLANLLKDIVGEKGEVSRLGGGAFGVLLEPGELTSAQQIASRILTGLNQYRLNREGLTFSTQARAGLAGISPQMDSADDVLACADLACRYSDPNEAIPLGVYDPEMRKAIRSSSSELVAELVSALENDRLCLQYQPIVDLNTDRAVWLEVLLASKDENDVASTLQDRQFASYVYERLNYHKVEPRKLCIDVTASTDVSDHKIASENLMRLGQLGCQIALDDFGTGTSSLQNLKHLPANFLKINHVFHLSGYCRFGSAWWL